MYENYENENAAMAQALEKDDLIRITVVNQNTGVHTPEDQPVSVYPESTMQDIVDTIAKELGLEKDSRKIRLVNKRTYAETSDLNTTVKELGLEDGDVLGINPDSIVA